MTTPLALLGGKPSCRIKIPNWPVRDEREERALIDVCRRSQWWVSYGFQGLDLEGSGLTSEVLQFQREFAHFHQSQLAVATSSGTAALDAAIRAYGFEPGDEVIVPAYTYVASATCALQSNLVPVFADIDPNTYNLDPRRVEDAITERTRAVIAVHFAGRPADMDALVKICDRRGLRLIEDAAQAHGAKWKGRRVGGIGHCAAFSFQGSKNMTAGEGGALATNDSDFASALESLVWGGRERGRPWYEVHRLGWNYRMTEFQAALLRVQLTRLDEQNSARERAMRRLNSNLHGLPGFLPLEADDRVTRSACHLYVLRYDPRVLEVSRSTMLSALAAEGVPAFSGYEHPLYRNPLFTNAAFINGSFPLGTEYHPRFDYERFSDLCPAAERACVSESIWMTHNVLLAPDEDLNSIAGAFWRIVEHADQLRSR